MELFRDETDYLTFLNCLKFALQKSACELWAWALMSNHYHLVLYGSSDQLTQCMYLLNRTYARYHNNRYRLGGHVFDGPYQAFRTATVGLTLWTIAYVFLNPVKASLCTAPEDYRWSGYRSFLGMECPLAVNVRGLMDRMDLSLERAWERFHDNIRRQLRQPATSVPGRATMSEVHQSQFEWLWEHAATCAPAMSVNERIGLAAYWAKQCGIAPRAVSRVIKDKEPAEISRELYLFKRKLAGDPSLAPLASVP